MDHEENEIGIDVVRESLENSKAVNVVILDARNRSVLADYFVFCSGNSEIHVQAIANNLARDLKQEYGVLPRSIEGSAASRWLLADYQDVLVHIFHPETRKRYAVEALFKDYPVVSKPEDWEFPADPSEEVVVLDEDGHKLPSYLR